MSNSDIHQTFSLHLPVSHKYGSGETQGKTQLAWRGLQLNKAKLKAASRTSALLSGFAMIAIVELQIEANISKPLVVAFAVSASLLVAVHILALMISTCILPNLESYSAMYDINSVKDSPHEKMRRYIETAWVFSTGLGILLFLVVVVLAAWVKFQPIGHDMAAIAASVILCPVVIIFLVFAILFYRRLVNLKWQSAYSQMIGIDHDFSNLEKQNNLLPNSGDNSSGHNSGAVLQV